MKREYEVIWQTHLYVHRCIVVATSVTKARARLNRKLVRLGIKYHSVISVTLVDAEIPF